MTCTHPVNDASGRRVPCGRCLACKINRGQEWSLRLYHELSYFESAVFVTLTYNDENIPDGGSLSSRDVQLFIKRLRKEFDGIKYYIGGEYGPRTNRPHYHGVIFGINCGDSGMVNSCWGLGFVKVGTVTLASINYVTAYINKKLYGKDVYKGRLAPFALMSKGLGRRWLEENIDQVLQHRGVRREGRTIRAPRYYMKRLNVMQEGIIPVELSNEELMRNAEKKDQLLDTSVEAKDLSKADLARRMQIDRDLKWNEENLRKRDSYI